MNTDHLADTLQFVAASIPGEYSVKVDAAARQLLDMHKAGNNMAALLNRILMHEPFTVTDITDTLTEWDNLL